VRAAAAILCLDDVAARNLAQVIKHAIPEPRAATDSGNVDDQLSVTDQLLDALDRNAAVLSGIDGVLVPLLSATGPGLGAGLAKGMAQLTPVPAELSQALHDVIGFAHHPLTGITPAGMIEGFIHYVEHSIVPGVGTLFAAGDDAPLDTLYLAKFLGKDVGSTYLHQAAKTRYFKTASTSWTWPRITLRTLPGSPRRTSSTAWSGTSHSSHWRCRRHGKSACTARTRRPSIRRS